jgi:crotonobetainyl-CoA:carnitine CoA-transferase CaiB-like acyl-CoA transferase
MTADDRWIIVAANQDTIFRRLCGAMGTPEFADDPRFVDHKARSEHQDEIEAIVGTWVRDLSAAEAPAALDHAGVVVGAVYDAADIVEDPQFTARQALVPHCCRSAATVVVAATWLSCNDPARRGRAIRARRRRGRGRASRPWRPP